MESMGLATGSALKGKKTKKKAWDRMVPETDAENRIAHYSEVGHLFVLGHLWFMSGGKGARRRREGMERLEERRE